MLRRIQAAGVVVLNCVAASTDVHRRCCQGCCQNDAAQIRARWCRQLPEEDDQAACLLLGLESVREGVLTPSFGPGQSLFVETS